MTTSTNQMKSVHHITDVLRHIEQKQVHRYESLIFELNSKATIHMIRSFNRDEYDEWRGIQLNKFNTPEVVKPGIATSIDQAFDTWDTDKSGELDRNELLAALKGRNYAEDVAQRVAANWYDSGVFRKRRSELALTVHGGQRRRQNLPARPTPASHDNVAHELTKEDFEVLMVSLQELERGRCVEENTETWLEEVLDMDGDGMVSVDEFLTVLSDVCAASNFKREDIVVLFDIINGRADNEAQTGNVEIAEFVVWLKHFSDIAEQSFNREEEGQKGEPHSHKDEQLRADPTGKLLQDDLENGEIRDWNENNPDNDPSRSDTNTPCSMWVETSMIGLDRGVRGDITPSIGPDKEVRSDSTPLSMHVETSEIGRDKDMRSDSTPFSMLVETSEIGHDREVRSDITPFSMRVAPSDIGSDKDVRSLSSPCSMRVETSEFGHDRGV